MEKCIVEGLHENFKVCVSGEVRVRARGNVLPQVTIFSLAPVK